MASRRDTSFGRMQRFMTVMFFVYGVLAVRLAFVQVIGRGRYLASAENQHYRIVSLPPERGKIYDRNGIPLALNLPAVAVVAQADSIRDAFRIGHRLAPLLNVPAEEIIAKLKGGKGWVEVARQKPPEVKDKINAANLEFVGCREDVVRRYPKGRSAAQLVGFTRSDGAGAYGAEGTFDALLRGRSGKAVLQKTGRERVFTSPFHPITRPVNGADVVLTIDARYQHIAYEELERTVEAHNARGGSVIIMKPRTGEVLAICSAPSFDPNAWSDYSEKRWKLPAVTDQFEPGSTFKTVSLAAMLDSEFKTPEDQVFCENGKWTIYGHTIEDTKKHGRLSVSDVYVHSSNIGMAKLALDFSPRKLYAYAESFGFGKPSGIEFEGEAGGMLKATTAWSKMTPLALSFGHEVAVTPLQMAAMFSTIANNGIYTAPRIVLAVAKDGKFVRPAKEQNVHRVISKNTAAIMQELMAEVVQRGTGTQAAVDGVTICGKTGTARVVREEGGGYAEGRYNSSFGGFFPKEKPVLTIFVLIQEPRGAYYGGSVAAPCFKRIVERIVSMDGADLFEDETDDAAQPQASRSLVPNLVGMEKADALRLLKRADLKAELQGEGTLVVRQDPPAGTAAEAKSVVTLALAAKEGAIVVPRVERLPLRNALNLLSQYQLEAQVMGNGVVVEQHPAPGKKAAPGDKVRLVCRAAVM